KSPDFNQRTGSTRAIVSLLDPSVFGADGNSGNGSSGILISSKVAPLRKKILVVPLRQSSQKLTTRCESFDQTNFSLPAGSSPWSCITTLPVPLSIIALSP